MLRSIRHREMVEQEKALIGRIRAAKREHRKERREELLKAPPSVPASEICAARCTLTGAVFSNSVVIRVATSALRRILHRAGCDRR
jgi:hypothetical protein